MVAGLIALLLNPFVVLLQRRRVPRGFAVLIVYGLLLVGLAGLGVAVAGPIGDQASTSGATSRASCDDANRELANVQHWLDRNGINVEIQKQGGRRCRRWATGSAPARASSSRSRVTR